MFAGKPIIGIIGGVGSGKSLVARLFGEFGCCIIVSDDQVREAYRDLQVVETLRQWWGDEVIKSDGTVNRRAIAAKVFADPGELKRLEQLLHPMVIEARDQIMREAANDMQVRAFVWDTPLLVETGLDRQCDALVFVESPFDLRMSRVQETRGWDGAELTRREKLQSPLDRKRKIADYVLDNTADADYARGQVRDILSRIFAQGSSKPARP